MIDNLPKLSSFEEKIFQHAEEIAKEFDVDEKIVGIIMFRAVRLAWEEAMFINHELKEKA